MIRRFSVYGGYDDTLRWLAVACAFTLSLPTAWLSFASGIFAVMYILTGNFSTRFGVIKRNPPALTCVILSLWMAVALTWSPASWSEGFDDWWKYRELLLFPAIGSLIWIDEQTANQWQGRLLVAFLAGFFIAFVVSWFRWVGLHPAVPRGGACDHPGDAVDREHLQADGVHHEGVATLPGHGSYTQPEGEDARAHAHPRSVDDAAG